MARIKGINIRFIHDQDFYFRGAYQGTFDKLKVIGNSKAGATTSWIKNNPSWLDELEELTGKVIHIIFLVRHPADLVTSKIKRRGMSVSFAINIIRKKSDSLKNIISSLQKKFKFKQIYYEDIIENFSKEYDELMNFLQLDVDQNVKDAIESKLYKQPDISMRRRLDEASSSEINQLIRDYDFFHHYSEI